MELDKKRQKLPHRETTICFVVSGRKVVAQKRSGYVKFPGGGVDAGETPEQAVERELLEEVGAVITKPRFLASLKIDWHPEWIEGDQKRKERYQRFRGEHIHVFVAFCKKMQEPTSQEGDIWEGGVKVNSFFADELHKIVDEQAKTAPPNFAPLYSLQSAVLKMIKMMVDMAKKQKTLASKNSKANEKIRDIFLERLY